MTAPAAAALINLLGYITGSVLYAMLLAMALGRQGMASSIGVGDLTGAGSEKTDRLPLLAALLGVAWNLGAVAAHVMRSFANVRPFPSLLAVAFTALGFLPAVVVHSLLRTSDGWKRRPAALAMTIAAYGLSATAGVFHFQQVVVSGSAPSHWALRILTVGFAALTVALLLVVRRQSGWRRAVWVSALALFAVSASHLSHHEGREYSWWVEVIGHHASLPLAVAILYEDYRFALADIFLKRALALVLLVALASGLYLNVGAPLLERRGRAGSADPFSVGLLIGLWVVTALVYPWLRRSVVRFVDAWLLRRVDYEAMLVEIARRIADHEAVEPMLDEVCERLKMSLTARAVKWVVDNAECADEHFKTPAESLIPLINKSKTSLRLGESEIYAATVSAPTAEPPRYRLLIGELTGGRRLLSDDLDFLESVALMVARRIDAVRVIHERCQRDLHEQEIRKLATEAELRALRAQINPHFLFNALTTIGYLIQTTPDRALETLMRLTQLLRSALRRGEGEFATLGQEIELIESYLDIERARFEDRLRVKVDVPLPLRQIRVPALLIQPLVENAIKHGVAPCRAGGEVMILARLARGGNQKFVPAGAEEMLQIWVRDTGVGASERELAHGRARGIGLQNVEQRIKRHYGDAARFDIRSASGVGTTVELSLPVRRVNAPVNETTNELPQTSVRIYG
ncbi:MAG: histidine kinase [Chloracidobacterium sp.]|nr:histidine kinase [Chloracidobacterium sp.]